MVRRMLKVLLACALWFAYLAMDGDIHLPTVLLLMTTSICLILIDATMATRGKG